MGDTITDTSKVAGTSKVTGTGVANTAPVLGKAGAPAAGKQPPPPPAIPAFKDKAAALAWANEVVHKDLGLNSTSVYWFSVSASKRPHPRTGLPPDPGLVDCGFAAWTNTATDIYLFDALWDNNLSVGVGSAQQAELWATVAHESLHAVHFKSAWGGGHPPSLATGFHHEWRTYAASAKALGAPTHSRVKRFIAEAAGKDELARQKAAQEGVAKEFAGWYNGHKAGIGKLNADQAELEYLKFFEKFNGLPPKILASGKTPKEMLQLTYGY